MLNQEHQNGYIRRSHRLIVPPMARTMRAGTLDRSSGSGTTRRAVSSTKNIGPEIQSDSSSRTGNAFTRVSQPIENQTMIPRTFTELAMSAQAVRRSMWGTRLINSGTPTESHSSSRFSEAIETLIQNTENLAGASFDLGELLDAFGAANGRRGHSIIGTQTTDTGISVMTQHQPSPRALRTFNRTRQRANLSLTALPSNTDANQTIIDLTEDNEDVVPREQAGPVTRSRKCLQWYSGHSIRKKIESECPICSDAMKIGGPAETNLLTWCKDGCGNSIHTACFQKWERHCDDRGQRPTCVICRIVWRNVCGC